MLALEREQHLKANQFIDKRIGEHNSTLTTEDRMLLRTQRQRIKSFNRHNRFDLNDDDDDIDDAGSRGGPGGGMSREVALGDSGNEASFVGSATTGRTLGETTIFHVNEGDDGEAVVTSDKKPEHDEHDEHDEQDDQNDLFFMSKRKRDEAAGDNGDERKPKKSRREVFQEIIAKSKAAKVERALQREKREDMIDDLDRQWKELSSLLAFEKDRVKTAETALAVDSDIDGDDDYDKLVNELMHDKRSTPRNRLKSPEEVAQETRERLETLEKKRQQRMHGEMDDDDDKKSRKKKIDAKRAAASTSADRLDDEDMMMADSDSADEQEEEEEDSDKEEDIPDQDEEDEDDDKQDEGDDDNEDDADATELDNVLDELDEDQSVDSEHSDSDKTPSKANKIDLAAIANATIRSNVNKEIPYLIDVPENNEKLVELIYSYEPTAYNLAMIIERIRAANHVSLKSENRGKLEKLLYLLLEYFESLLQTDDSSCLPGDKGIPFQKLDVLTRHIFQLGQMFREQITHTLQDVLRQMESELTNTLASKQSANGFPPTKHLIWLKFIGVLYPTSDLFHKVATPALIFANQCLASCPVKSLRDVSTGLYLCALITNYNRDAGRYSPEVISWLINLLSTTCCVENTDPSQERVRLPPTIPSFAFSENWLDIRTLPPLKKIKTLDIPLLDFVSSMEARFDVRDSQQLVLMKLSLWNAIYVQIGEASSIMKQCEGFPEAFASVIEMLERMDASCSRFHPKLMEHHKSTLQHLREIRDSNLRSRKPLQLQRPQVKEIKQFAPRFFDRYTGNKWTDRGANPKARTQRLQSVFKQARRSAARELRRQPH